MMKNTNTLEVYIGCGEIWRNGDAVYSFSILLPVPLEISGKSGGKMAFKLSGLTGHTKIFKKLSARIVIDILELRCPGIVINSYSNGYYPQGVLKELMSSSSMERSVQKLVIPVSSLEYIVLSMGRKAKWAVKDAGIILKKTLNYWYGKD